MARPSNFEEGEACRPTIASRSAVYSAVCPEGGCRQRYVIGQTGLGFRDTTIEPLTIKDNNSAHDS